MTKNSRQKAKKKTVAKNAVKANQRKLQKRAQTDNVTAKLDKDLGLVYSVKQTEQTNHVPNNPPQVGGAIEELLKHL